MDSNLITQDTGRPKFLEACDLAAALMLKDGPILIPLFLFCAMPAALETIFGPGTESSAALAAIAGCVAEIIAFAFLAKRWLRRSDGSDAASLGSCVVLAATALITTFILRAPFLLFILGGPFFAAAIILAGASAFVWTCLYFYFAPILAGLRSPRTILRIARAYCMVDWAMPIKISLPGVAFMTLGAAACTLASPDHRHLWAMLAFRAAPELFWIPACYLSIAAAAVCVPESVRAELGFAVMTPAEGARGRRELARILAPGRAAVLIGAALLIRTAAEINSMTAAPAPSIKIIRAEASGDAAEIELELQDSEYGFRGFTPRAFALGSEKGTRLGLLPEIRGEAYPDNAAKLWRPILVFEKIKFEGDLTALKDLVLWYRSYKVSPITLQASATAGSDKKPDK